MKTQEKQLAILNILNLSVGDEIIIYRETGPYTVTVIQDDEGFIGIKSSTGWTQSITELIEYDFKVSKRHEFNSDNALESLYSMALSSLVDKGIDTSLCKKKYDIIKQELNFAKAVRKEVCKFYLQQNGDSNGMQG